MKVHNTRTENSKDFWETPPYFFEILNKKYNFTVDIASSDENCLVEKHYTKETDGLRQDLEGERAFCNPPYDNKEVWLKKCYEEGQKEKTIVVVLIPDAMDTQIFHDYCMKAYKIYAVKGRIQFLIDGIRPFKIREDGKKIYNGNNRGSLLIVFKKHNNRFPKLRPFYHLEKDLKELSCKYLDDNNQCSNLDIDTLECRERMGYNCDEKNLRKGKTKWCACGDEILIAGHLCENCKFMEEEINKNKNRNRTS